VANDAQTPGRVFISYRRTDTAAYAGRLYDHLVDSFGEQHVLMDVDSIEPGTEFRLVIEQAVASCEILIVLIGRQFLDATEAEGRRRIDDPDDYVRLEIEAALRNKVFVTPVLTEGSLMPRAQDLPVEIQAPGATSGNGIE